MPIINIGKSAKFLIQPGGKEVELEEVVPTIKGLPRDPWNDNRTVCVHLFREVSAGIAAPLRNKIQLEKLMPILKTNGFESNYWETVIPLQPGESISE